MEKTINQKCIKYIFDLIIENTRLLHFRCAQEEAEEELYCLGYIYIMLLEKEYNHE